MPDRGTVLRLLLAVEALRRLALIVTLLLVLVFASASGAAKPYSNEGGGGGGYPPNMCRDVLSGHNTYINGHLFRCSYDWGSTSNWEWSNTYGFINGCPWNQNPCWYWHPYF